MQQVSDPIKTTDRENAWDAYVKAEWGGWTAFASMHTQVSGRECKQAFMARYDRSAESV